MHKKIAIGVLGVIVLIGAAVTTTRVFLAHMDKTTAETQVAAVEKAKKPQKEKKKIEITKEEKEMKFYNTVLLQGPISISDEEESITSGKHLKQVAKKRAEAMIALAKTDPRAFLRTAISAKDREKLPKEVQDEIEVETTVEGTIEVLHEDDFSDERKSKFTYHVRSGKKRLAVYFADNAPPMMSGSLVKVNGYLLGDSVVSAGGSEGVTIVNATQPESVGTQNTLIILVTSPGLPSTPSKETMRSKIFSGAFSQFYNEQSYGKVQFVGDVTDWISVPRDAISWCGSPELIQPEIQNYLTQKGISLALYDRVMFITNGQSGGCAYVGKLDFEVSNAVYNLSLGWSGFDMNDTDPQGSLPNWPEYVLVHEMGHQLGVMHANSWSCTGGSLDTDCHHSEYGNSYDAMGNGYNSMHFNAFYKDVLGWLAPSDKVTISQSGQYQLAPLEAQSGVRAAIIKNPALPNNETEPMYLEYRTPVGFDATLPASARGIHVNQVVLPYPGAFPMTRLINTSYLDYPNGEEPLLPGKTFTWDSRGISIGSLTTSSTTANFGVSIEKPSCDSYDISVVTDYISKTVSAGSWGYVTYSVTNNDTLACNASSLTYSAAISPNASNWYISQSPIPPLTLAPGETNYIGFSFEVPADTTSGNFIIKTNVNDTTHSRSYEVTEDITVVAPPKITAVTPTSGVGGRSVTLSGTGFALSPNTNTVNITGDSIWESFEVSTSQSGTLAFTFPTTMTNETGQKVPTPPGLYSIQVFRNDDYGYSNLVTFRVNSPSEITVLGGSVNIADGDTTPTTTDRTDFGSALINTTGTIRVFTVRNDGDNPLSLSLASSSIPQGFKIVDPLVTSLASKASDTFSVQLVTTSAGTKTGQISITNNDSNENPFNFSIKGVVTAPEIEVLGNGIVIADGDTTPTTTDKTDFGVTIRSTAPTHTYTVKNIGTGILTTSGLTVPTDYIIVEGLSPTIAPGTSDTFQVKIGGDYSGFKTGQINFMNNDSNENPFNFTIKGSILN